MGKERERKSILDFRQWFYAMWRLVLGDGRKIVGAAAGQKDGGVVEAWLYSSTLKGWDWQAYYM